MEKKMNVNVEIDIKGLVAVTAMVAAVIIVSKTSGLAKKIFKN